MKTFRVYREVRRQQRSHEWGRPAPTKVKDLKAENIEEAARTFVNERVGGKAGWAEPVVRVDRRTADVWLRRYTPGGRYKGETHFLIWPEDSYA